ncbi:Pre-mRNA splicing helicase BRR2/ longevity-assurance protein 1/ apoptosis inhibitor 1 [Giardia duodenalis assemblage B]|uniref:Pre-mRNA splicing helicase BRR2/ longevity-assurance protein 1/ apoptosis inhibitor 1 n=1 Tax=Giardia duodenalis assemblage B TaxID=1394984 RepID=A0A132NLP9_GIAIN|nr:Pre-mRNA splicing helicase BRR2/ longevity-assurance protein 1/ apoptosis inhibitor 1 [Giardia intestinalis assemblage B]
MITIRQKMSLDGPARRSNIDASAEPAVKRPSSYGETALMRAAARKDVAEVRRHLDKCGGEMLVIGLRLCMLRRRVK